MTMGKWKLITNVSFADYQETRIWCHGFLIQMDGGPGFLSEPIRQMRAITYGGLNSATFWIKPDSEVQIFDAEGNTVLMSQDGNDYNLGGMIVRATGRDGKLLEIALGIDNFRGKMVIEDIEQEGCPFGDEIDERILPHAGGQAYPRVEWTMLPERFKRKATVGKPS
jgi:hypothetical protein